MERVTLRRLTLSPDHSTHGIILRQNKPYCSTLERPWLNNENGISCIPAGLYKVTKFNSPSKGEVFLLHDVPGRSMIEMHVANHVSELKGCIAVGQYFTGDTLMVSRLTLEKMLNDFREFELEIINPN